MGLKRFTAQRLLFYLLAKAGFAFTVFETLLILFFLPLTPEVSLTVDNGAQMDTHWHVLL